MTFGSITQAQDDRDLDDNPQVVQRRGGWFATGTSWSGPWRTQRAAELALEGRYKEAHTEHRAT